MKLPIQKVKFNLYKNKTHMANVMNFSNQCSDSPYNLSSSKSSPPLLSLFMYINILLYWVFCSVHIWLDIRARKAPLKKLIGHPNIQSTWRPFGHLDTWREFWGHWGTWALKARGNLGNSGTQELGRSREFI